jgi:uncharacterized protein YecT (DUF1311 family)
MNLRSIAAIVGLVAASAAAAAQGTIKPSTYYTETFNRCMAAAGGSTYPIRDCQSDELGRWDSWLNEVYRALMGTRSPVKKTELRGSERAWLHRTSRKCDHAGDDEAGGSLQPIEVQSCYLDETVIRTVYLRSLQ